MSRPVIREGIRFKPIDPGNIVGAKSFNPVQAVAEALANVLVILKMNGETISTQNIKLSGRNSVLELDLTGIAGANGSGSFRGLYQSGETYNYGDTVLVLEEMILFPSTPVGEEGKNWWLSYWLWPHASSSSTTTPRFDANAAVRSVVTLPAPDFSDVPGTGPIPSVVTSGGNDTAWLLLSISKFFLPTDYSGDDTNTFTTLKTRGGEVRDVVY